MPSDVETALAERVQELFVFIDSLDFERVAEHLADDVRAVDELSGGWRRGRDAFEDYYDELKGSVERIESQLGELDVAQWGEAGLVTFELDQRYTLAGETHQVHAPTSIVFRCDQGGWKIALMHSVPLTAPPP